MPTYHGLYFPYIHFQDEAWLKTAALYWDRMYRIVPSGMRPNDTDEVKRFEELRFVGSRDPSSAAQQIAVPFRDLLRTRGKVLKKKFSIFPGTGSGSEIEYIYNEKIFHALRRDFKDLKLVVEDGPWLGMHRELARVYMTALAETLAPELGARLVADNSFDHVSGSGVTMERLVDALLARREAKPDPNVEVEQTLATIAFRQVIPRRIRNIPASEIIKFREKHGEERTNSTTRFREY